MDKVNAVLVVGGGVGGVQAALDMAEAGLKVYLVERAPAIGGYMAMLDKTFPTNDCSMCILSPKLVFCARHPNIELLTLSEVVKVTGEPGNFQAQVRRYARSVDLSRCTGCGSCLEKCPVKLPNEFEGGLSQRRAIYRLYAQAVPNAPAIDRTHCLKFTKNRCGNCEKVCQAGAINYGEEDQEVILQVGAVVLSSGSEVVRPDVRPEFGYARYPNVVTSLEFERILSASGPFGGHILRPSDKKEPKKIAWVQCFGSRDESIERSYCSTVCCMYAVKEAVIAKEHNQNIEPTVFYMDIRAFGKDFDRYIERAERQYGVRLVPARVAEIREEETKDLTLRYATEAGQRSEQFDMVVLSCGFVPPESSRMLFERVDITLNQFSYPKVDLFAPISASRPGFFIVGSGQGPKDIPETVTQASAAAANCLRWTAVSREPSAESRQPTVEKERPIAGEPPRIGVFVCHCGINIGGIVRVPEVVEFARSLPGVVFAQENLYSCSADSLKKLKEWINEKNLNRVVVASCSPRTHEPLFQATVAEAGLNPHLFAMANIRDQCSWVHMEDKERATEKAKDLVRMAVARVRRQEPLRPVKLRVTKAGLVIGGGISGMSAALALADAGFDVYLVEREKELGGIARTIWRTIEGEDVQKRLAELIEKVSFHPRIRLFTNARITRVEGFVGSFTSTIQQTADSREPSATIEHGVVILATGARYRQPEGEYGYGESERVITQEDMERLIAHRSEALKGLRLVVMVQCVGSREDERPYCSRICCTEAIKNAIAIKEQSPETEVIILYRDIRTYGLKETFYRRARELGVNFIRYTLETKPKVQRENGLLRVRVYEPILRTELDLTPDLLVLSSGLVANPDTSELGKMFKVPLHQDRFFLEAHAKLRPVDFATEGVFLCGLCHYPKFIDESIASAQAAAGRAITVLARDFIEAEPYQAVVNLERCSACGMCEGLCAYRAIEVQVVDKRRGKRAAVVNSALCKGCGTCAANCRSQAIDIKGFLSENIYREIAALFTG
ncbi:MAG: CoB--CoM heterodisulfide reductase iron-sulfur subunit A family protein [candidate division WOR-3 bacterium]